MNSAARLLVVFAGLVTAFFLLPQPHAVADDWLPVSAEDLALKDNPAGPGADAMILFRDSAVSAKGATVGGDEDEEYMRIKIFTQAGVRSSNVEVPFVRDQTDVKDVRGRTIHPDGSIVNFDGKTFEKEIVKRSGPVKPFENVTVLGIVETFEM